MRTSARTVYQAHKCDMTETEGNSVDVEEPLIVKTLDISKRSISGDVLIRCITVIMEYRNNFLIVIRSSCTLLLEFLPFMSSETIWPIRTCSKDRNEWWVPPGLWRRCFPV